MTSSDEMDDAENSDVDDDEVGHECVAIDPVLLASVVAVASGIVVFASQFLLLDVGFAGDMGYDGLKLNDRDYRGAAYLLPIAALALSVVAGLTRSMTVSLVAAGAMVPAVDELATLGFGFLVEPSDLGFLGGGFVMSTPVGMIGFGLVGWLVARIARHSEPFDTTVRHRHAAASCAVATVAAIVIAVTQAWTFIDIVQTAGIGFGRAVVTTVVVSTVVVVFVAWAAWSTTRDGSVLAATALVAVLYAQVHRVLAFSFDDQRSTGERLGDLVDTTGDKIIVGALVVGALAALVSMVPRFPRFEIAGEWDDEDHDQSPLTPERR